MRDPDLFAWLAWPTVPHSEPATVIQLFQCCAGMLSVCEAAWHTVTDQVGRMLSCLLLARCCDCLCAGSSRACLTAQPRRKRSTPSTAQERRPLLLLP